jgi:uroporphyrinogen-III synthase
MSVVTAKMNQEKISSLRRNETRDVVTLFSALAGAILFLAVPEFGIPAAIAAASLGAISGVTALTKPRSYTTPPTYVAHDRRTGRERRMVAR